jgi:hypothetical protein
MSGATWPANMELLPDGNDAQLEQDLERKNTQNPESMEKNLWDPRRAIFCSKPAGCLALSLVLWLQNLFEHQVDKGLHRL